MAGIAGVAAEGAAGLGLPALCDVVAVLAGCATQPEARGRVEEAGKKLGELMRSGKADSARWAQCVQVRHIAVHCGARDLRRDSAHLPGAHSCAVRSRGFRCCNGVPQCRNELQCKWRIRVVFASS